jgi:polar amino acid transport system permease protein
MITSVLTQFVALARSAGLNFGFLIESYERGVWLHGIVVTLELSGLAAIASLAAGLALALAATSPRRWLSGAARALIGLTRNTPTLVQLYCAFLVLNSLINDAIGGAQHNPLTPFAWVLIVIAIHIGAFHAESLRAGLEAVPKPTLEAAAALGFGPRPTLLLIRLPLALRTALPSLTNNMINLIKLTSIGSAIAVGEVTYASIMIWSQHDNVVELMILILALFSGLNMLVDRLGRRIETWLGTPGYGL